MSETNWQQRAEAAERACAEMRMALRKHHEHDQESCNVFFEQDGKPLDFAIDLGEAYGDSQLAEQTTAALSSSAGRDYVPRAEMEKAQKTLAHIYELAMTEDGLADFDADSIRDEWQQYVPRTELEAVTHHLRELLAVIHRDGGQHTEAVGLEQSVTDAQAVVCEDRAKLDEKQAELEATKQREERLRDALQWLLSVVDKDALNAMHPGSYHRLQDLIEGKSLGSTVWRIP